MKHSKMIYYSAVMLMSCFTKALYFTPMAYAYADKGGYYQIPRWQAILFSLKMTLGVIGTAYPYAKHLRGKLADKMHAYDELRMIQRIDWRSY